MATVEQVREHLAAMARVQLEVAEFRVSLVRDNISVHPVRMAESYLADTFTALLESYGEALLAEHLANEIPNPADRAS